MAESTNNLSKLEHSENVFVPIDGSDDKIVICISFSFSIFSLICLIVSPSSGLVDSVCARCVDGEITVRFDDFTSVT